MKKLRILFFSLLAISATPALAQYEDYDIDPDEIPYGLQEQAEQDEASTYIEKNYLAPLDEDVELEDVNPYFSEEYYIERLKAIPGPEEFHVYNSIVRSYIDRYTVKSRRSLASMLGRYNLYSNMFDDVLVRYDVPEILNYLPIIESALNPKARSHAGASGLWQFMPSTAKTYGLEVNSWIDERNDPYRSTEAAARLLKYLYEVYGDWSLVLAAYNCGPGNVNKAISRAGGVRDYWTIYPYLPRETRGYVPAFIAAAYIMNNYSQHNIKARKALKPIQLDTVVVHYDMNMEQISAALGIEIEEVKGFNPQYRSSFIPGARRKCTIALPMEMAVTFAGIEDSIYHKSIEPKVLISEDGDTTIVAPTAPQYIEPVENPEPRVNRQSSSTRYSGSKSSRRTSKKKTSRTSRAVTVRQGDNLSTIAKRNHTTVAELKRKNGLKGDRIRAGQKLKVK